MNLYALSIVPIMLAMGILIPLAMKGKKILKILPLIIVAGFFLIAYIVGGIVQLLPSKNKEIEMDFYAKALFLSDDYESALTSLEEVMSQSGENYDLILSLARIKVMQDDYAAAKGFYAKAMELASTKDEFPEDEYTKVLSLVQEHLSYSSLYDFVDTQWGDVQEYEFLETSKTDERVDVEQFKLDILDYVEDEIDEYIDKDEFYKDLYKAMESATSLELIYNQAVSSRYSYIDDDDIQSVEKYLSRIEDVLSNYSQSQTLDLLKGSLVRGYILLDETEQLVDILSEGDVYDRILLSQLYLNNIVDDEDFEEEQFLTIQESTYDKVINRVEDIVYDHLEDYDDYTVQQAEKNLEYLENQQENGILVQLKINIVEMEEEIDASMKADASFAQAQIDVALGNETSANVKIEEAFSYATESVNDLLSEALVAIKNDLENKELSDEERVQVVSQASESLVQFELPNDQENEDLFDTYLQSYVSKKKASVTISSIHTDDFTSVQATFSIDSSIATNESDLRSLIEVYDCAELITNYQLEKINFTQAYTMLVSDISGSMSGNEEGLKNAIISFSEEMTEIEKVSIIGFNSEIVFQDEFTANPEKINESTAKIIASGGTNIYGTLMDVIDGFSSTEPKVSNVIILMTDGYDGYLASDTEIETELTKKAIENNVIVYTIGLGSSVDYDYLTKIARAGGGQYINISNPASMEEFYIFLHQQLDNQYLLTFDALDETSNQRELNIKITGESAEDTKTYTLYDLEDVGDVDYEELFNITIGELSISNLDTKNIYQSEMDTRVIVYGNGFNLDDNVQIKLSGSTNVNIEGTVLSNQSIEFYVPANILVGSYDVNVTIQETLFELTNALNILEPGSEEVYKFGEYIYIANNITTNNDTTILSGNVRMNNWLNFNGELVITGDKLADSSVKVYDAYGSTVNFNVNNSQGIASFLSKYGVSAPLPQFGNFTISKIEDNLASSNYGSYAPAQIAGGTVSLPYVAKFTANAQLYHDRIEFTVAQEMIPLIPEIDTILAANDSIIKGDLSAEIQCYLNANVVGVNFKIEKDFSSTSATNMLFAKIPLEAKKLEVEINTLKNNYAVEFEVELSMFQPLSVGLKLEIEDGKWKEAMLGIDIPITPITSPVPITFSDFKFGLTGMEAELFSGDLLDTIYNSDITAVFTVAAAQVTAVFPQLEFLFDDASLISINDITLKTSLADFRFEMSAKLKLLSVLEVGSVEVALGQFTYSNILLNINELETQGIKIKITQGIDLDTGGYKLQVQGASEAVMSTQYLGLSASSHIGAFFELIWEVGVEGTGDFSLAFYENNAGNPQLSIIGKVQNKKVRFDYSAANGTSVSF